MGGFGLWPSALIEIKTLPQNKGYFSLFFPVQSNPNKWLKLTAYCLKPSLLFHVAPTRFVQSLQATNEISKLIFVVLCVSVHRRDFTYTPYLTEASKRRNCNNQPLNRSTCIWLILLLSSCNVSRSVSETRNGTRTNETRSVGGQNRPEVAPRNAWHHSPGESLPRLVGSEGQGLCRLGGGGWIRFCSQKDQGKVMYN